MMCELNDNTKIYKSLDEKLVNNTNIKLYTWNNVNEEIKLIDDIIKHYFYGQNWNKFIRENSNTIDIGAHSGDTLIPLILGGTNFFKTKTKILALEPNPYVRECCKLNAINNISENIEIIVLPFAVTDKDDYQTMLYDHGNDMCNGGIIHDGFSEGLKQTLTNTPNKKGVECIGMKLETICNNYFTEEEIKNISFIKIDTEGYDREIIYSSKDFLNKIKPVIFMEWFDFYDEKESLKLFEIIKDLNYFPFNPATLEIADINNKIWDLLLIHKDDIENLKKTKML
jgi:FkbM family methyltransferase